VKNLSAYSTLIPGKHARRGSQRGVPLLAAQINEDRFNRRVDRSGGPDACWPWLGRIEPKGYGTMAVGGRQRLAHRCAMALAIGEVPRGKLVLHACDNPPCVNPAHLRLGTQLDNMRDMVQRGRKVRGEKVNEDACWRHGYVLKAECAVCKLEADRAAIERAIARLLETRARWVAKIRGRLTFPVPDTCDKLAAIVGRSRALVFASHFGLYGFAPMRMADIAKAAGGSRQRIDQIIDAVSDRLRQIAAQEAA
jgi:hypothetical protein